VRQLVLDYYVALDSALSDKPEVRRLLAWCRHCGIPFIGDPRNTGREDLGCPFGCADLHRSRRSTQRSAAYNRSPIGKLKRRQRKDERRLAADRLAAERVAAKPRSEFAPGIVSYIRMVISLLEGRHIHREEILEMLARTRRQHSFAREKRIDYVLRRLGEEPEHPP
jgi:hypothetical protein